MADRTPLAERMATAARELQDQDDPQTTMDVAAQVAARNVRGCDAAGLSVVRRRKRIETPAHTDDFVITADELQNELHEGPCRDAIWDQEVVHSPDLEKDERWPTWGPRMAGELGIHSMLCFRLFTHQDTVGAINFYSRSRRGFDEQDRDDGLALAAHIAVAVVAAQRLGQLATGMENRTVIAQASGILMERFDLDAERAFQVLARISSHSNRKLHDVAHELVTTRRVPEASG